MNTTHRSPAAEGVYEVPADTAIQTETVGNNSTFSITDSAELKLLPPMSPAATDDTSILYIEKGEVTLVYDSKTYILSRGMLFYKVPQEPLRLLNFSEDCHFKIFSFAPQYATAGSLPIKYLDTITVIASNNPVFILDTLTAASVTVLFWLLQKKAGWEETAQSPDETIEHVFSLLMLEIISSYKKSIAR